MIAPSVAAIGEAMVELSKFDANTHSAAVRFAGDTLNAAVYLRRSADLDVAYVTALGQDQFSDQMIAGIQAEQIDTSLIHRDPTGLPGIYAIELDTRGERRFRYWRAQSAARRMFDSIPLSILDRYDVLYLSGITLAILPADHRNALIAYCAARKQSGAQVVFDSNYRPLLWPDADTARTVMAAMWQATTIALPSTDDETTLWGDSASDTISRIAGMGATEIILKRGDAGVLIDANNQVQSIPALQATNVVDTTAAGDSFNGAYLATRLTGASTVDAVQAGQTLATKVIAHSGAILDRSLM